MMMSSLKASPLVTTGTARSWFYIASVLVRTCMRGDRILVPPKSAFILVMYLAADVLVYASDRQLLLSKRVL